VSELDRAGAENALQAVYRNTTTVAGGLGEADLMRPSRCAGWALGDVLYHRLLDARRALRTFASPAAGPPDVG
jgi:Mycothiol maleylpyruvate isomerase N-terminal domain